MAVGPINASRLTHNMRSNAVIESLRQNQLEVFREQTRIATGRRFSSASEDPIGAAQVVDLSQALSRQERFVSNLRHADNTLAAADNSLTEINSLIIEAMNIASENVSNLTSADERQAVAEVVRSIRGQLQAVGNREFNGRYLFAGHETTDQPFVDALGGIAYLGDTGNLVTRVAEGATPAINISGDVLFGALSSRVESTVDLSPVLAASTRLDDLNGATANGIRNGTLTITEVGGAGTISVNLSTADTIGDVVDLINSASADAGAQVTASISGVGVTITPGGFPVAVTDTSTGVIAADLGILTPQPTSTSIDGVDLGAKLTRLTPVADIAQGTSIDIDNGLIITNGLQTATIDLSNVETVQDIINRINNAGVFVTARINDAGTGVDFFNQVSGTSLSISENGGTTAADLGIRTFNLDTQLSALNFGQGVSTIDGQDDFRVTAKDGSTVDVNIDGLTTVGEVIDAINVAATQAAVTINASLTSVGNGISIEDNTGGTGTLTVGILNQSVAAEELGLMQIVTDPDTTLNGEDRNLVRTEGVLGALIELESALRTDDTVGITLSSNRVQQFGDEVIATQGAVGAQSKGMQSRLAQMEDASITSKIFLSDLQDLDYAEAITNMQAATTQLQASLSTSSVLLNLSLIDFLR